MRRWPSTLVLLCGVLLPAWPVLQAQAQSQSQDERRLAMTRAALRQAQEALQAAEAREAALARDKAALTEQLAAAQRDGEAGERARATDVARSRSELRGLQARSQQLETQGAEWQRAAEARAAELDALRPRHAAAEASLREQRQLTERMAALLERSTRTLAEAEAQNTELVTIGERILDAYRHKTAGEANLQREPLFGLERVRVESRAEALQKELDALRRAPAAR